MPLKGFATDVFGVVTICLVALLILLGLLCILYSFYFRAHIHSQGYLLLDYFNGPWIIRITFILFAIWWGIGEITRLNFLRHSGRVFSSLNFKWQEAVCKCYIVSNLGFAEPCLFLTLVFLLRAPLENVESGILSRRWNRTTTGYIMLYTFPMFLLQLILTLVGPQLGKLKSSGRLPHYFTSAVKRSDNIAFCTYPLLSTIILGLFALILTTYLFWLGRQILKLVLNKGLQRRVKALIFSMGFLSVRVLFLGLSVLSKPEYLLFEVLAFLAFLAFLSCAGLCICMLVYCPVADSLAVGNLQDMEVRRRTGGVDYNETSSLISNIGDSSAVSLGRNSDASTKHGSISFRAYDKEGSSTGTFVELSVFSPGRDAASSLMGWPLQASAQVIEQ
ncbi:hypothetical protein SAY86_018187 [Trapa natans]|uniref:Uncharacterized protein n=1 Tax=Trapa natans TaxID=22666 RepID=A0AAN7LFV0_TRANT|nr:hypothetical protein SAY86_018187 [Trapa natans]